MIPDSGSIQDSNSNQINPIDLQSASQHPYHMRGHNNQRDSANTSPIAIDQ